MNTKKVYTLLGLLASLSINSIHAVTFDSGSDETDGALVYPADLGEVKFDPDAFDPPLDADGDGIYNFTTISIGSGTYVRLGADILGTKPLIWLASGAVEIDGILDLSCSDYFAGVGGFSSGTPAFPKGQGPGGSDPGISYSEETYAPTDDYVNPFLIPLIGGSGVGMSYTDPYSIYLSGGGALLLASSDSILITGAIAGGHSIYPSNSANIRLVSNKITLEPLNMHNLNVLRLEAYDHNYGYSGSFDNVERIYKSRPGKLFPDNPIKITVVDGNTVTQGNIGANKGLPDVTINNSGSVTIKVECSGIPLGREIRVVGWNDSVGRVEATTNGLTGTVEASEATCTLAIPTGNTTFMAQLVPNP